jgi:uncharacterized protein (TIGR00269 family)
MSTPKTCQYCPKPAVYYRKISNETVCKEHFILTIENKIRKTVRAYNLFSPQDKVVVGVSGGKDSLALLYNVKKLQQRNPHSPQVEAILIDEGIHGYRCESTAIAQEICAKWDVPLHIVSFKGEFGKTLDETIPQLKGLKMNACTVCGTVRRRLLNEAALKLQAHKLAIGHNLDDTAETLLQNILRSDLEKIQSNPPMGNPPDPDRLFVPRVKPMMEIPEAEVTLYCYYLNIPIQTTPCPYVENFSILRKKVLDFLNLVEGQSPEIKYNLLSMNLKLLAACKREGIPEINNANGEERATPAGGEGTHRNLCKICGFPAGLTRDICYYCELKEKFSSNYD